MVAGWPAQHTYKHLKWEVLVKLIKKRDEMATLLQPHLNKQALSYKEAVEAINDRDNIEEIPEALGDFSIAAISLTTQIPVYVVYPTSEKVKDVGTMCTITKFGVKTEYLFHKDRNKAMTPHPSLVIMVYNGKDYYAPTIPREIGKLMRNSSNAVTHLDDAETLIESLLEDLPPSATQNSISNSLWFMRAVSEHLSNTSLTTGTTSVTDLLSEVSVPKPVATVTKSVHCHAAAVLDQPPPEKRANEKDAQFTKRKKAYKALISKAAKRDMKLGKNQCPCSETFQNFEALLTHQGAVNPDPKCWKCAKCPKAFNSKRHCWSHTRKHFGKYYHYCDVTYKDEDDLDEEGKPKEKVCMKGADEMTWIEFHRETDHKVRKASIRCDYCDQPQQSNRVKLIHHDSCNRGPNADGELTHFCDLCTYSCQSRATLHNHINCEHPEETGATEPKCWRCSKCAKIFKLANGYHGHDCMKKKKRRGRKPKGASATVSIPSEINLL